MAKYRVFAKMTSYAYLDVEAETGEKAKEIAENTDGGVFTEGDGDWEIGDAIPLEPQNNTRSLRRKNMIYSRGTVIAADMDREYAKALWAEFGDIPIDNYDRITCRWRSFEEGTNRFVIWRWFEDFFQLSIEEDLGTT